MIGKFHRRDPLVQGEGAVGCLDERPDLVLGGGQTADAGADLVPLLADQDLPHRGDLAQQRFQLFRADVMSKLPSLQAWYDDPDGPEARTFSNMEIGAFKQWLEKQLGKFDKKRKKAKDSKVSATKKRARSVSSDSDRGKGSKGYKKSKAAQYDSDKLDESSVEDSD